MKDTEYMYSLMNIVIFNAVFHDRQWAHLEQDHLTRYKKRSKLQRLIRTWSSFLSRRLSGTRAHSYSRLNPSVEPTWTTETSTRCPKEKCKRLGRSCMCWNKIDLDFLKSRKKQHRPIPAGIQLSGNSAHLWYSHGQIQAIRFHFTWELYLHVGSLSWEPESWTRTSLAQILHLLFPRLL